jgi:pimeloyl-ACP methyl ester carboxylesterase
MARYVLVHGAFAGAWCWAPVVTELERRGHTVQAPDLPGSGEDDTPADEVSLDAYADKVCESLAAGEGPAVLVGHSMGGVVITQAASRCPDLVDRLVYVAAFLPGDGQSLKELTELPEGPVAGEPPVAHMSPSAAREVFYGSCDDEQAAWALAHLGHQPVLPFVTPVSLGAEVEDIPRDYVLCSADRAIPPALQRRMIVEHPCGDVLELPVDHSPWISATRELSDFLTR